MTIPEIIMEARAANVRANPAGPHGTLDQLKAGGAASRAGRRSWPKPARPLESGPLGNAAIRRRPVG